MAQNKKFSLPPAFLANAVANILNPPTATGGVNGGSSAAYILINQFQIANVTAAPVTYTLYKGATGGTAAGTEIAKGVSVPANTTATLTFSGGLRFDAADFLTGLAGAASSLVISGEGEIGISG